MVKKSARKYSMLLILFLLLAPAASFLVSAQAADPGITDIAQEAVGLIENGGLAVKNNDTYLFVHNLHTQYVPASIIKIATALAALDILGPSFRFETSFYRDSRNNLYIKGYGDPFLISEEVASIIRKLKSLGVSEINDIYLDNSAFKLERNVDGSGASDNPYDAQNSALAVNFNTINIEIDAMGRIISAEEQTPTLEVMARIAEGLNPGVYRLNISRDQNNGEQITNRYVGELFRAIQKQEKIDGTGMIAPRQTPENLEPFYLHRSSKTLKEIIGPLMHYSNNFIANQLFLGLGNHKYGYPATWEKSKKVMADFLRRKFNLSQEEISISEGSGLSRNNRVSPHAMILLLDAFKPYAALLPQKKDIYLKSGTLEGVYTYAGYFRTKGRLDSFVLLLNQSKNNRDELLDVLAESYRQNRNQDMENKSGTSAD